MYNRASQPVYLTIHELKMFAPVRVNGQGTFAYLDTAANLATISTRFAEQFPRTGKMKIRSAFEEREFDTVSVDIEFMGKALTDVNARVHEIERTTPFEWGITLSAHEIFSKAVIYDFHILGLLAGEAVERGAWKEITAEFLDIGLCIVEMQVGTRLVKALFDTGAGFTVVNKKHTKDNGMALEPGFEMEIWDATGANRKEEIKVCRGLRLGRIEMPAFDSMEVDLTGIEEALGRRIDLVFGANAMLKSGLRWLFDRSHNQVFVKE